MIRYAVGFLVLGAVIPNRYSVAADEAATGMGVEVLVGGAQCRDEACGAARIVLSVRTEGGFVRRARVHRQR